VCTLCVCMYVDVCVYGMYVYMYKRMEVRLYVCMYVCMCVWMYVCVYGCMYVIGIRRRPPMQMNRNQRNAAISTKERQPVTIITHRRASLEVRITKTNPVAIKAIEAL